MISMKYPNILFDLDNTIFDTKENARLALRKMRIAKTFPFNEDQIHWWFQVNDLLWGQFEDGTITRDQLLDRRFNTFFGKYDIHVDSAKFEEEFQYLFASEHELMPNAINMLDTVSKDHHLFVVSNGTKFKQYTQLDGANITNYFDKIFLSEDIGYKKPDIQFFDAVKADLNENDNSKMLVVGDSLSADIDGANRSHIDSVWYDTEHETNNSEIKPTYTIDGLDELLDVI
ncbi:noncanonical pyrimidine nucleotidase, YjjG family [Lactobacillus salsicarnum]|uniref:Noncanonical pyrimidine nucleotidase, YjjG family n=2 Tax=Companilactobacillus mishanensis TaxID=2486008 RepID=A0A5P0ZK56_9LACO|nr:noncanonical pyrimidine nucleotidase, YjjG family [Companilactobacillus mishanensis]